MSSGIPSLPIGVRLRTFCLRSGASENARDVDRKSTRLNSSHLVISYAVFCLKKKKPSHCLPRTCADSSRAPNPPQTEPSRAPAPPQHHRSGPSARKPYAEIELHYYVDDTMPC